MISNKSYKSMETSEKVAYHLGWFLAGLVIKPILAVSAAINWAKSLSNKEAGK